MFLEIVAAVNDDLVLGQNLAASPVIVSGAARLTVRRGYHSASIAYNSALDRAEAAVIVFAHQDVYLPLGWERHVHRAIDYLNAKGQRWGVLGVFGVARPMHYVGSSWSTGLGREVGSRIRWPESVVSVDEMLIVLNRAEGLRFDESLPGFHLYGTDIVQTSLQRNLGAFIFDGPVIHNSRPVRALNGDYARAYWHMRRKWANDLPLETCIVPVTRLGWPLWRHRLRSLKRRLLEGVKPQARLTDPAQMAMSLGYHSPQ